MTVEELIDELRRQPNKQVPIGVAIVRRDGAIVRSINMDVVVKFDGRQVVIEAE